jgi:hypothetical protein
MSESVDWIQMAKDIFKNIPEFLCRLITNLNNSPAPYTKLVI